MILLWLPCNGQQHHDDNQQFVMVASNHSDYPEKGYMVKQVISTDTGLEIPLAVIPSRPIHGKTIHHLVVEVDFETSERLHVKIRDEDHKQVPVPDSPHGLKRPKLDTAAASDRNYDFTYTENPFGFQVIRASDQAILFDTRHFPLVFEDQYLEISTSISEDTHIYGFGETPLKHLKRQKGSITTLFARDAACPFNENIYGTHPFYMEIHDGKAHGVLLLNAHGQDVLLHKDRITWKVIGGVLEYYFFVPKDNKPNSVMRAYTDLVGKPMMIAHWMLGWQHCRWGYHDIEEVEAVIKGYKDHSIPLEVKWIDIDYMDTYKDFTFDPQHFPEHRMCALSDTLHQNKQRMVVIVDAGKATFSDYGPYTRGKELDVFMKNPDGSDYVGQVWPGYTVFPDWFHPNASTYWEYEVAVWLDKLNLDGLWIDMDEPSSFCLGSCGTGKLDQLPPAFEPWTLPEDVQQQLHKEQRDALHTMAEKISIKETRDLLYPGYAIRNGEGDLSEKTVAMTAYHYGDIAHYDLHSLYGHAECSLTRQAMIKHRSNERPFILSRSTFSGSGQYSGHWTGDNWSTWTQLKSSIIDIFNVQMFGISYSGADICGFNGNATEELCTRWVELGAFYPFARNHNVKGAVSQAPYEWESTAEALRKALAIRYALLPYLYTVFEESHRLGTGVWRPLIFEYPHVNDFADHATQVLVGKDVLLSPVLDEGATTVVDAKFPSGVWYDWYTHERIHVVPQQDAAAYYETYTLDAPLTHIPVHVRGGAILPLKQPEMLVEDTFSHPYTLLIALDENEEASGRLYMDDGHSIHQSHVSNIVFSFSQDGVLHAQGEFAYHHGSETTIKSIQIVGKMYSTATYQSNNDSSFKSYTLTQQAQTSSSILENADIPLTDGPFTIRFDQQ
ncbi:hypothetical protein O0I10_005317 [Lichtheimia ornata]|uniref:Maltase n=1 Tax=Lichtheimia ornata TaxID=688661 RepID=A0AAD7V610_9FUNG|nr:uncharacterized protein O0I10_005317 [Lichtheimia ornata]KAJ8658935.1 hypothetical protein O0I10_005317 [Lichtheimia ornata]